MKIIPNKIQSRVKLSRILCIVMSLLGIGLTSTNVFAWGPERTTYTNENPAPYATFNSITNNAAVGDERNFVRIGEAGSSEPYADEIEIIPGKEYEVYIYFHNDAADNTNATGYGIATSTMASSAYPTTIKAGTESTVSGVISWNYVDLRDKTHDAKVWDEAYLTTKAESVNLRYKVGSATIHNSGKANGSVLSTALFTEEGTYIGYNELKGVMPGCAQYSGYITYILIAEETNSTLEKQVSADGENWSESINLKPGEYATYKVAFKNTGNTVLTNVIFKDQHDEGLNLRPGSTTIYDVDSPSGREIADIIDISGYNTGDANPDALVQAVYQMQVANDESLCGKTLTNTMVVSYNGTESKEDTAKVKVYCGEKPEEPETPEDPEKPETPTTPEKPEEERPTEIVNTGPLEITLAVLVLLSIIGAGVYYWRTHRALKNVEDKVSGKKPNEAPKNLNPEPEKHKTPNDGEEKKHNQKPAEHKTDKPASSQK